MTPQPVPLSLPCDTDPGEEPTELDLVDLLRRSVEQAEIRNRTTRLRVVPNSPEKDS